MELSVNKIRCSMRWFSDLLANTKVEEEDKAFINNFINAKLPTSAELAQLVLDKLFTFLSTCLRANKYVVEIAVAFEQYLLLIVTEALNIQNTDSNTEYQRKCLALAKLIQFSTEVKHYASSYFRNKPAPFLLAEGNEELPKNKRSKHAKSAAEVSTLDLVKCCYQLLRTDLAYFKELWEWTRYADTTRNRRVQQIVIENNSTCWLHEDYTVMQECHPCSEFDIVSRSLGVCIHTHYIEVRLHVLLE